MLWKNKDILPAESSAFFGNFSVKLQGPDLSPLAAKESGVPFLKIRLTSVLDVTDDFSPTEGGFSHAFTADGKGIGGATDSVCKNCGGFKRDFSLDLPLSFYFENLTGNAMIHVTPNRLYQEDGAVIFPLGEEGAQPRYLLFIGRNCILHTEGKQLLVTVKEGEGKWRFRLGNSAEELAAQYAKR